MSGDLKEGIESSEGDPRVLFVLNVILSTGFAYLILIAADLVGMTTFTLERLAAIALVLIALTYVVTNR